MKKFDVDATIGAKKNADKGDDDKDDSDKFSIDDSLESDSGQEEEEKAGDAPAKDDAKGK